MDHKLRAFVRVDLTCSSATIYVTGWFTTVNYRALIPIIRRARALPTHPVITVDVSQARHVEPHAVRLLEEACRSLLQVREPDAVTIIAPLQADYQLAYTTGSGVIPVASAASEVDAWLLVS